MREQKLLFEVSPPWGDVASERREHCRSRPCRSSAEKPLRIAHAIGIEHSAGGDAGITSARGIAGERLIEARVHKVGGCDRQHAVCSQGKKDQFGAAGD